MFEQTHIKTKLKSNYGKKKKINPLSESINFDDGIKSGSKGGGSSSWEDKCPPYTCVPPEDNLQPCDDINCSDEYEVELLDMNDFGCFEFICRMPVPDVMCKITGSTFTTFDNTKYKYNICSHILAMDRINGLWSIVCKYLMRNL